MSSHQRYVQDFSGIPQRYPAAVLDQFMYLMRAVHDCQGRYVITFAGELDAERMARAVRLTLDAEPVLGCRFVEHPWRPYWQRCDSLDTASSFSMTRPEASENELMEFMTAPIDPFSGPQVQVHLFHSDHDVLCIKINHMVADAGGIMYYINLLARIYRELEKDSAYRPDIKPDRSRELGQVFTHAGIGQLIRSSPHFFYPRSAWGFPRTGDDLSGRVLSVQRINHEQYTAIRDYSHSHKVSVDDVMLTAFYRALFRLLDPPVNVPLPVEVTVNLRRYMPPGWSEVLCNLSAAYFPAIRYQPGAAFVQTLSDIHKTTVAARRNSPWLAQTFYLRLAFLCGFSPMRRMVTCAVEREIASGKLHPFYANIGIIRKEQADFGNVDVADFISLGPVPYPPACIFSFNSFEDAMVLTTGFCSTATEEQKMKRLLDTVVSELPG